jgi:ATP-dependent exoDNAse (exonuclease V) beta subunit
MQNEGVLDDSMKIGLSEKVKKILRKEKVKNWFSTDWEVKSESEILLQDGSRLRPDRVMIKDKNACVIDYKTGAEKEEDKRQVNKYVDVLKTMGYEKVEKYLLYINDENSDLIKIIEL